MKAGRRPLEFGPFGAVAQGVHNSSLTVSYEGCGSVACNVGFRVAKGDKRHGMPLLNDLAHALAQRPYWEPVYYVGKFSVYNMNAVRHRAK